MITSKGFGLFDMLTGRPIKVNDRVAHFNEEMVTVLGATSPMYPGSTGRVYIKNCHGIKSETTPRALGLEWKELTLVADPSSERS